MSPEWWKMPVRKVFVSFDYENDRHYKYLLEAWDANPNFEFVFNDQTPDEIQSRDVGRVKAAITAKISQSTYTLVIVGKYANSPHRDRWQIGFKNWINFEVHQSKEHKNRVIAVFLDWANAAPDECQGCSLTSVYGFDKDQIVKALSGW
jgi:hypothetical protein